MLKSLIFIANKPTCLSFSLSLHTPYTDLSIPIQSFVSIHQWIEQQINTDVCLLNEVPQREKH